MIITCTLSDVVLFSSMFCNTAENVLYKVKKPYDTIVHILIRAFLYSGNFKRSHKLSYGCTTKSYIVNTKHISRAYCLLLVKARELKQSS